MLAATSTNSIKVPDAATASILNAASSFPRPDSIRACAVPRARPIPAFWAPDIPLNSHRDRRLNYFVFPVYLLFLDDINNILLKKVGLI